MSQPYMRAEHFDEFTAYLDATGIPYRRPKKHTAALLFNKKDPKDRDTDNAIIRSAEGRMVTRGIAQMHAHRFYTARLK